MGKTVQPQAQRLVRFALAVLPGHGSIAYTRTPSDPLLLEPLARMSSAGSIKCVTHGVGPETLAEVSLCSEGYELLSDDPPRTGATHRIRTRGTPVRFTNRWRELFGRSSPAELASVGRYRGHGNYRGLANSHGHGIIPRGRIRERRRVSPTRQCSRA